ncbi:esterase/lipase/thioesterase family active site protein [Thecamonas trahens ATCC 50062]|uniref:Esterase/lipase/thioesterase family active site protein n=1 Tax=Thecamonas trahens ATCC 50062 TaxID=461836 RepID=A0A0L0DP47_THETB|nr:esterase/lipase/thioesterase family active site protein [Thecamonas trahens ATCC 50062]KNC54050.1 esterase/lipase/thioesterase family active site protein [Thecamonas trahens ATCC 50062]|eukprot:XP_013754061.1 esterase/lipase/thioesterase family active site protein [Thecamonas trahens ATCC 50062]
MATSARSAPARAPPVQQPVALCHGYMGFGKLAFMPYFHPKLVALVEAASPYPVTRPVVSPLEGIAVRAGQLADALRAARAEMGDESLRFNVVAHSMAGLDVRYLIAHLGGDELVASLTTLGTPHRGSAVADVLAGSLEASATIERIVSWLGISTDGLRDLTTAATAAFNAAVPNSPRVLYFSVASYDDPSPMHPYAVTSRMLRAAAPSDPRSTTGRTGSRVVATPGSSAPRDHFDSDGLVTVASAKWGKLIGIFPEVNHTDLMGFPRLRPKVVDIYKAVLANLERHGL